MARFVVRRLIAMIVVMFIVSVLTFVMLVKIPGGDPGQRLAGRSATQAEIQQIDAKYGFNKPIYEQYANTMKNIFTGEAYSYTQGFNVLDEIKQGLPATLSLAIGAGIFWLLASIAVGTLAAVKAGKFVDRLLTVLSMAGVSVPAVLPRRRPALFPRLQGGHLPARRLREVHRQPVAVVHAPDPAVVHAVGAVHRLLLTRAALDDSRHHQRGLRPHRPREGAV